MKKTWKKTLALGLSLFMVLEMPLHFALPAGSSYGAERPATVKATSLNVRSGPGTGYSAIGKLSYGAAVTVLGEAAASNGAIWYQIRFTGTGGAQSTGYVLSSYIQFPTAYSSDANFEAYLNAQGFPESYRPGLRELHARYPQWVFTAVDTGLDWNEVIQNESLVGRNLVSSTSVSSWKSTADGAYDWGSGTWPGFDGSSWVAASEDIIRYYMDPRNFLNETYVFQFLGQSYNSAVHTREGLAALVKGTFLEGSATGGSTWTGVGGNGSGNTTTGPGGSSQGGTSSGGTVYGPGYTGSNGVSSGSTGGSSAVSGVSPGGASSGSSGTNSSVISPVTSGSSGGGSNVVIGVPPGGGTSSGGSSQSSGNQSGNSGSTAGPGGQGSVSTTSPVQSGHQSGSGVGTGKVPSNVRIGVPPGTNVSKAGGSLSVSPHSVLSVAATVIRVGPGGQGEDSSQTSSSGNTSGETYYTGGTASYVDILMQAGVESGVNPYVLAAMILQEQGNQGKSESISGASGYYNFFNFEAYASNGMTAVQRGLWYASQPGDYMRPWNSVDKAIIGGACQYGQNYVKAGQNTFYLKKFNVQGSNLYKHQYMTNVEGAAAEGAKMAAAYSETMRQTPLQFMIPVYRNMPGEACAKPTLDGSPNNKLSTISVDGFTITPAFNRDTSDYQVSVNSSVSSVTVRASAIDSSAQIAGVGTVNLVGAITDVKLIVTAQNGSRREYNLRILRSDSAPVSNGSVGTGSAAPTTSGGTQTAPSGTQTSPAAGTDYGPGGSASTAGPGSASSGSTSGQTHSGPGGSNVTIVN